jgi:hypothetical protein
MFTSFAASVPAVTVRALLVCLLSLGALAIIGKTKSDGSKTKNMLQVSAQQTPIYREPNREYRLVSLARLSIGAIIAGAILAIALSVTVAYVVGTVTNLLQ